ncbi:hsp70 family protein [Gigaspora margarita]|uniref:Hsp70 family protein n=1 Tax=Gigaspora margarita TaxID=4874 RepID=A0A8H3XCD4_GIGMA|nr:hsp70 family protein [Gigaspora margarita]
MNEDIIYPKFECEIRLYEILENDTLFICTNYLPKFYEQNEPNIFANIWIIDITNKNLAKERHHNCTKIERKLPRKAKLRQIRTILEKNNMVEGNDVAEESNYVKSNQFQMGSNYYFLNKDKIQVAIEYEVEKNLVDILQIGDILHIIKTSDTDWARLKNESDYGFVLKEDIVTKAQAQAFYTLSRDQWKIDNMFEEKFECKHKLDTLCNRSLIAYNNISATIPCLTISLRASLVNRNEMFTSYETTKQYSHTKVEKAVITIEDKNIHLTNKFKIEVEAALNSEQTYIKVTKITVNMNARTTSSSIGGIIGNKSQSEKKSELLNSETKKSYFRIIGGDKEKYYKHEKINWMESLKNSQSWEIIEYDDIHSIFDLLDNKLRKKALKALGQRILKAKVETLTFELDLHSKKPYIYPLHDKLDISNLDEYQIFASLLSYPSQFDCFQEYQIKFESNKYTVDVGKNNQYTAKISIPHKEASNILNTCLLSTCILESPDKTASNEIINFPTQDKVILYKEHPTTVIGTYFSYSKNSACLFIHDLKNEKNSIEESFLQRLKLFSSTVIIEDDNYKDYVGQAKIKWNNNRSQPRIFCGTGDKFE